MLICSSGLKRGYENLKNSFLFFFLGLVFTCGKAYALPQDWPCDAVDLNIISKGVEWGHMFQGNDGLYEITIHNFDGNEEQPHVYNCGNSGCLGTMKNLKTGTSENMRFDCLFNSQKKSLRCSRIDGDEYLLTKESCGEYRVQLCGGYYKYLDINQCVGCSCVLQDSRGKQVSSDMKVNCTRESNDKLRCFSYDGYESWCNFENKDQDFENCIGLNM